MSEDKRSTEEKVEKIEVIDGAEVLGYEGSAREEHSGEKSEPRRKNDLTSDLADNKPEDLPKRRD